MLKLLITQKTTEAGVKKCPDLESLEFYIFLAEF
jgi:hypothetical protein